ncbi:RING finger domain-containing protein [Favolaschia claudopus]|uniref:RING finger domain-containing protein n=1 Tax=Favolaschia claudopus TaxID=2862362 RepID=A0AAW0BH57_9AGAR
MARTTRTTAAPPSAPRTRRSTRLNNQELKNHAIVEIQRPIKTPTTKRRTRRPPAPLDASSSSSTLCSSETLDSSNTKPFILATHTNHGRSYPRRSTRITPTELLRRESALEIREVECHRRQVELDARATSLAQREDEARALVQGVAIRESKATLAQLEEHFTCALCVPLSVHSIPNICSLAFCVLILLSPACHPCASHSILHRCYDIMAQPYSLNPGQCGHTFCALCILRHFFSRLHKACGGWHESVDCPMCRSLLVITPERPPRLDITFPFVPNRTAAALCESMVEKLSQQCAAASNGSSLIVKREESVVNWSGSESLLCDVERAARRKGKGKLDDEDEMDIELDAELVGWREGGNSRTEWLKKDREGKKEMLNLFTQWTTMGSQEFILLKQRLGV